MKRDYAVLTLTWPEFLAAVHRHPSDVWLATNPGVRQSENRESGAEWDLNVGGYDGAVAMLSTADPWPTGRRAIERDAAEQATRTIRRRGGQDYAWATEGDVFDMALVQQGDPACWLGLTDDPEGHEPSIANLMVSVSAAWNIDSRMLADRMRAIAATVLTLEACDIPVVLWSAMFVEASNPSVPAHGWLVQVKPAGQPLNLPRLVTVAHPAYLRRLHFRLIEQSENPAFCSDVAHGYGRPCDPDRDRLAGWTLTPAGSYYYCPAMTCEADMVRTASVLSDMQKVRTGIISSDDSDDYGE